MLVLGDFMDSVNGFKTFIRTMPNAASEVHNGNYTWQQLYEMYVLYGENHEVWHQFKDSKKKEETTGGTLDLNVLLQMIKSVDVNALVSSMDGLQKVLGIVATLFDKDEVSDKGIQSLSRMDD